jgi:hypothetical protein
MADEVRIYRVMLGYPHVLHEPGVSDVKVGMFEELSAGVAMAADVLNTTVGTWVQIEAHEGDSEGFELGDETQRELTITERDQIARRFDELECEVYPIPMPVMSPSYHATNMPFS